MKNVLHNILSSGIRRALTPEELVRLYFLNSIMIMGSLMLAFFGTKNLLDNLMVLGLTTFSIVFMVVFIFFLMRMTQNFDIGRVFIPIMMACFFLYLLVSGGNENSGALWMTSYSLFSIFLLGGRWGGILSILFMMAAALVMFIPGLTALTVSFDFKSRLLGVYIIIMIFSLAFENIRRKAQKETEASRNLLLNEKAQTDGIMANVQEGIFLIQSDLSISSQYSLILENILGTSTLAGQQLTDVLKDKIPEKALKALKDYLEMFFLDHPNTELLADINPLEKILLEMPGESVARHLEFSFGLVKQEKKDPLVLATVRDTTEQALLNLKLKEEESRSEKQMRTLFQVIHVNPELMSQFLEDAHAEIESVNGLLKSNSKEPKNLLDDLFHSIHAIKGNAVLLGLQNFGEKAHYLEQRIVNLKETSFQWSHLLDITVELSNIQAELTEISQLIEKVMVFQKEVSESEGHKEDLLILAVRKALEKSGQDQGKKVRVQVEEFEIPENLSSSLRKDLKDILIQLARNAVYHGIESPEQRLKAGKPEEGLVNLCSQKKEGNWVIIFEDDGQGLSVSKIKNKIRGNPAFAGLDVEKATPGQLISTIFQPGFSTADEASLTAGRGVGLSLVKERVEGLGGKIRLKSNPGKGCTFEVLLPL